MRETTDDEQTDDTICELIIICKNELQLNRYMTELWLDEKLINEYFEMKK